MKKKKPKAKPGSAKKSTANKSVKADKKAPRAAKAAKPAAKAAKPGSKGPLKSAQKTAAKAVKVPAQKPIPKSAAKYLSGKPLVAKPGAIPSVAIAKGKPNSKEKVKAAAKPGKPSSTTKFSVAVKPTSVKPMVEKTSAVPKVNQAKAEPKPIVIEEPDQAEDVVLTDADGRRYCRVKDCDRLAEVDAYCRYHYILLWKNIQTRRHILQEGKLERYIEELTARYPDKFLEILKKDLRSEKDFLAAIQELEIDESAVEAEFDDEESQSDLFEIQRVSDSGGGGARSEEDDRF